MSSDVELSPVIILTKDEKTFVALALQGLALRAGLRYMGTAYEIAKKLGVSDELIELSEQWIKHAEQLEKMRRA